MLYNVVVMLGVVRWVPFRAELDLAAEVLRHYLASGYNATLELA